MSRYGAKQSGDSKSSNIEGRAVKALTDDAITSDDIAALIEEMTVEVDAAKKMAALTKAQAFDPIHPPDPHAARQAWEDTEFLVGRLQTLLPRLQSRLQSVHSQELVAAYVTKRDELQPESDALAKELEDTYRSCAETLIAVFTQARDFEARARQALPPLPAGVTPLRSFDPALTRLLEKTQLFDFDGKQVWPPPTSLDATFVASMTIPHPGGNWADPEYQARRRAAEPGRAAATRQILCRPNPRTGGACQ
jgi:hypothetical protein